MSFIQLNEVKVHYPIRSGMLRRVTGQVKAVDGVSLAIEEGKTYGLVGESGCGKSSIGRAILGLNRLTSGSIHYEGTNLARLTGTNRHPLRRDIQMIFQDPYSSLNPKKRVLSLIAEPLRNFEKLTKQAEQERVATMLEQVGLNADDLYKYPHEFSGGQRQRIGIARCLMLNPRFIVADEPVSALDVSVQAQVLNFMKAIQTRFALTYLFISHDLGIVRHMCDHIGIMYNGRLVEAGTAADIYRNPQHIYTQRLIAAIPNSNPRQRHQQQIVRQAAAERYQAEYQHFFDANDQPHALQAISPTHFVALPQ
ncbi:ABC transporter ATP-binding protein [Brochothrix campestris]|uniref:Peptide ABC transporter ATP-binding protein n=1 Tax=Brochothrix campestris FSL F6-1037 TaxID=1265861 RepID=W7CQP9_9LIST|nr:ATP-binding cassette domain-containing protein [Brochothrix campestris]EUJ39392.1 peptide ABC transporter ATP-binding protein [Brochothrix campestris FSL F6-1037]